MAMCAGVVTLVQESRFQLVDDEGVAYLFVLAHDAAAEPAQLVALQHRQARVRVFYEKAPHLIANVAKTISLLDTPVEA